MKDVICSEIQSDLISLIICSWSECSLAELHIEVQHTQVNATASAAVIFFSRGNGHLQPSKLPIMAVKAGTKRKTAPKEENDKRVRIDPEPSSSKPKASPAAKQPEAASSAPRKSNLKKTA